MAQPRVAPVWLIGLSLSPFGFYGGILFYAIPQLLAARHVPEERIAGLTALLLIPSALSFLIAPILDVRFSRRWYATVCCALATAALVSGLLNQENLPLLGFLMFVGATFVGLFYAALGGWLASVIPRDRQPELSSWMNVASIGAAGFMAFLSIRLIRHFPLPLASELLACMVMRPTAIFLFIPAPGPDRRLARESFSGLLRAIASLFRRGEVIVVLLLLFTLPSSSFSLTNLLGGLGGDFHTTERTVGLINGVGVTIAGVAAPAGRAAVRASTITAALDCGRAVYSLSASPAIQYSGFRYRNNRPKRVPGSCVHGEHRPHTPDRGARQPAGGNGVQHPFMRNQRAPGVYAVSRRPRLCFGGVSGAFITDAGISITVCAVLLALLAWLRVKSTGNVEAMVVEAAA